MYCRWTNPYSFEICASGRNEGSEVLSMLFSKLDLILSLLCIHICLFLFFSLSLSPPLICYCKASPHYSPKVWSTTSVFQRIWWEREREGSGWVQCLGHWGIGNHNLSIFKKLCAFCAVIFNTSYIFKDMGFSCIISLLICFSEMRNDVIMLPAGFCVAYLS